MMMTRVGGPLLQWRHAGPALNEAKQATGAVVAGQRALTKFFVLAVLSMAEHLVFMWDLLSS
jgi:hypothetical protein